MRRLIDSSTLWLLRAVTYAVVVAIAYIILHVVWRGLPAISLSFLFTRPIGIQDGGILAPIIGTLYLTLGTIAIAFPLGMACAIYLSEYAAQGRLTRMVRLAIVTLAGIPSIVYGLFGLGLFVVYLNFGTSILSGCLTLACMVLPTIIVASEESLRAVPQSLREGSLALGASQWQTIARNVLPYAVPGMITGSILAIGRAAGETAPILLTVAAYRITRLPVNALSPTEALPYHLYILTQQAIDTEETRLESYGAALTLLLLVLSVNLVAILLRYRFRRKYRW